MLIDPLVILDEFDRVWIVNSPPDLTGYLRRLGANDPHTDVALPCEALDLFTISLEKTWTLSGSTFRFAEEYFCTFPGSRAFELDLIAAENQVRQRHGDHPLPAEYERRFPELWPTLQIQIAQTPPTEAVDPFAHYPPLLGYEILERIGEGGMAVVFRARDLGMGRDVAVKVLHPKYAPESSMAARFLEEARITGQLQHPGIPAIYSVGLWHHNRPFLAMKLIRGHTLDELLKNGRVHDLPIFEAACLAVGYAHAHGVIHRDLKPSNIMVGAFGEVQVMDWGLAKQLGSPTGEAPHATTGETAATDIRTREDSDGSLTQAGSILGTPAYMSPEQAAGEAEKVNCSSDVFGLGAILCLILTGKPPFDGGGVDSVRMNAMRGNTAEALARLDACGKELELVALCKQCLAYEPGERPADANVVANRVAELRRAAEERARRAELDNAQAEVRSGEQRKRRRVLMLLVVVLTLGIIGTGGGLLESRDQEKLADAHAQEAEKAVLDLRQANERLIVEKQLQWIQYEARLDLTREDAFKLMKSNLRHGDLSSAIDALGGVPEIRREFAYERFRHELSVLPRSTISLAHHDYEITALLATPDGTVAISSGLDGGLIRSGLGTPPRAFVEIRDLATKPIKQHALFSLSGDKDWSPRPVFQQLDWIEPGRSFASVDTGGRLLEWNVASGTSKEVFAHPQRRPLTALLVHGPHRLCGDIDGRLFFAHDPNTKPIQLADSPIVRILSEGGSWFVLQANGAIRLIDEKPFEGSPKVLGEFQLPQTATDAVLLSPDKAIVSGPSLLLVDWNLRRAPAPPAAPLDPRPFTLKVLSQFPDPSLTKTGIFFTALAWNPAKDRIYAGDSAGFLAEFRLDRTATFFPAPSFSQANQDRAFLTNPSSKLPTHLVRAVAGIAPLTNGKFLSAGREGLVSLWERPAITLQTEFRVGAQPKVAFDSLPRQLWVGDARGDLSLWNTVTGQSGATTHAHDGHILGLATTSVGITFSVGSDRSVRFWRQEGERIAASKRPFKISETPRRFAVAPNGSRFATLDDSGRVRVWEYSSLKPLELSETEGDETEMIEGLGGLSFDGTGDFLAAARGHQRILVWDLRDPGAAPQRPAMAAGSGATALRWHPTHHWLFAGDTEKRIVRHPEIAEGVGFDGMHRLITGSIFDFDISPDGHSLAALDRNNNLIVRRLPVGSEGWEVVAPLPNPVVVQFDPTGHRLLLCDADGRVCIYETGPLRDDVPDHSAEWKFSPVLDDARAIAFRAESVHCDSAGRCRVLYQRASKITGRDRPDEIEVVYGVVDGGAMIPRVLDRIDLTVLEKRVSSLDNTLALLPGETEWLAIHRRPTRNLYAGEPVLHSIGHGEPLRKAALAGGEVNSWFHPLIRRVGPRLEVIHYDYGLKSIIRSMAGPLGWEHRNAGRLNEGWSFAGALAPGGAAHLILRAGPSNRGPVTHLRIPAAAEMPAARETIDRAMTTRQHRLLLDAADRPVAVYSRGTIGSREDLVCSVRGDDGTWKWEVIRTSLFSPVVHDFRRDEQGHFWLLYREFTGRLCLARRVAGVWTHEVIWTFAGAPEWSVFETPTYSASLVMEPGTEPAVLIGLNTKDESGMKLLRFRPRTPR